MLHSFMIELNTAWAGLLGAFGTGHGMLLLLALLVACAFEFINGFHDTANAVATVIYTGSLRPRTAVLISGVCNFLGVFLGGTAVAMGIVKLLPLDLLVSHQLGASLAMVFALLSSAIFWNLGTWYLGLPASSSHTLIGSILGIGLAHSLLTHVPLSQGVNWSKAAEIGVSLLASPLFGFGVAGLLVFVSRRLVQSPKLYQAAIAGKAPPWPIRAALILTGSGVSLAHGSNDGQKGVGLIMVILIAVLPAQFSLRSGVPAEEIGRMAQASHHIQEHLQERYAASAARAGAPGSQPNLTAVVLAAPARAEEDTDPQLALARQYGELSAQLLEASRTSELSVGRRMELRSSILKTDQQLTKLEKSVADSPADPAWRSIQKDRKLLKSLTDYAPSWVILLVALSLGAGTLVGWQRVAVTIGEKIGKSHLTYAQGVASQLVAMGTIGVSALAGLPVSTTHVLSSGVAGTMVASRSGLHFRTIKSIAIAWILTLPVCMGLSALLYIGLARLLT